MRITIEEKYALQYCGLLGHEYIVLSKDNDCLCECNYLEEAQDVQKDRVNSKIFRQTINPTRKFERIS